MAVFNLSRFLRALFGEGEGEGEGGGEGEGELLLFVQDGGRARRRAINFCHLGGERVPKLRL